MIHGGKNLQFHQSRSSRTAPEEPGKRPTHSITKGPLILYPFSFVILSLLFSRSLLWQWDQDLTSKGKSLSGLQE